MLAWRTSFSLDWLFADPQAVRRDEEGGSDLLSRVDHVSVHENPRKQGVRKSAAAPAIQVTRRAAQECCSDSGAISQVHAAI